jgi:hypothetical protein
VIERVVDPEAVETALLQGTKVEPAEFMQSGFGMGPGALAEEQTVVLSDIENQELYLIDLVTQQSLQIASFGMGPGEVTHVVDLWPTNSGFAVLNGALGAIVAGEPLRLQRSVMRGSEILEYDRKGQFQAERELLPDERFQLLREVSFAGSRVYALSSPFGYQPPRVSEQPEFGKGVPDDRMSAVAFDAQGQLAVFPIDVSRQKFRLTDSLEGARFVLSRTRLAASESYIVLANEFLRYFSVFDANGRRLRQVNFSDPSSRLREYPPSGASRGFSWIVEDLLIHKDSWLFLAQAGRHSVSLPIVETTRNLGRIDVWDINGKLKWILYTEAWPSQISIRGETLLVVDDTTANKAWVYDISFMGLDS